MREDYGRLPLNRPQITSDGHTPYLDAVERAFGADVEFARRTRVRRRPSLLPGPDTCITKNHVTDRPAWDLVSTSYVERNNLHLRMMTRCFTRLTNAFSKTREGHTAAVHLFVCIYNLTWVHSTIRMTPPMALGVIDSIRSIAEVVRLALGADEARAAGTSC